MTTSERVCRRCRYFVDDPHAVEQAFVGLTILSSAWGDTRGNQGLCIVHQQFLTPKLTCNHFTIRR